MQKDEHAIQILDGKNKKLNLKQVINILQVPAQ